MVRNTGGGSDRTVFVNDYVIGSARLMQDLSWLEHYPQRTEGQQTGVQLFGVDNNLPPAQ